MKKLGRTAILVLVLASLGIGLSPLTWRWIHQARAVSPSPAQLQRYASGDIVEVDGASHSLLLQPDDARGTANAMRIRVQPGMTVVRLGREHISFDGIHAGDHATVRFAVRDAERALSEPERQAKEIRVAR